jgi:hypothetical protein
MLSSFFIINLVIGIVVDNYIQNSPQANDFSDNEAKYIQSRQILASRAFFFDLTNLHLLPPLRLKVYHMVSSKMFEYTIISSIILNTCAMAVAIFPAPLEGYNQALGYANYVFLGIFTVEAIFKLYCLRGNYFQDAWNVFDLTCVLSASIGFIPRFEALRKIAGVIRIARLFRLLRYLKELSRLFKCLIISIPKLFYVGCVTMLMLILGVVLGMNLFGRVKYGDTFNVHGSFKDFGTGLMTLVRASTGEAWNEIMHDLAKKPGDFFKAGTWCTPPELVDLRNSPEQYEVLQAKCLVDPPNMCPPYPEFSYFYWVVFTLLITMMVMQLVVAVILEGYVDGKETKEADTIDTCIAMWKKHDPEHRMILPLKDAVEFINDVIAVLKEKGETSNDVPVLKGASVTEIVGSLPMKIGRAFDMDVTSDNRVTFLSAAKQILLFTVYKEIVEKLNWTKELLSDKKMKKKDLQKLQRQEKAKDSFELNCTGLLCRHCEGQDLSTAVIAATKLQRQWRTRTLQKTQLNLKVAQSPAAP